MRKPVSEAEVDCFLFFIHRYFAEQGGFFKKRHIGKDVAARIDDGGVAGIC